jgi:tRNA uridine 5-carboxymethylaminomethyl modification enzyme
MEKLIFKYDVIIVGGGHAGCEAAHVAALMGAKTLLITMDITKLAQMSCNPSMGGVAKGQIVREIDALGGLSGLVTDSSMLQFRMLNKSKGPAMWSPRAQCDRMLFSLEWRKRLENTDNLFLWQDECSKLIIENKTIIGVETVFGTQFFSKTVVLTNGTFLNGLMHIGFNNFYGGRSGDSSSKGLTNNLEALGFSVERMKTGTSARMDGRYIDFSKMTEQKGDEGSGSFSYLNQNFNIINPMSCFIVQTNLETHAVLKGGLEFSPLFTGRIKGRGPRYCPSIEDKIVTFKDKKSHQLFIEPEGRDTHEYYINGFASSLPLDVQLRALRTIEGLENVEIYRSGYAIEYDFFQPTQLYHSLETKKIKNLFFAGQINGTTGYEEAASQGLLAGINAVLKCDNKEFILKRDESYIGVLIDDLVTKGVDEPYRMFTSRAEYRILLRQDNADSRLTPFAIKLGTASQERVNRLNEKNEWIKKVITLLGERSVAPNDINPLLEKCGSATINQKNKAINIALRPQVSLQILLPYMDKEFTNHLFSRDDSDEIIEAAEIIVKYDGYIQREKLVAEKIKRLENLIIPDDIVYDELLSISTEGRQKLTKIKPRNIGQASRILGVSPSDINVLLMYMGR